MQISKKLTRMSNSYIEWRKIQNSVRENVYTDKQLRPVLFKAMKKQSLTLTPNQIIKYDKWKLIQISESLVLLKLL